MNKTKSGHSLSDLLATFREGYARHHREVPKVPPEDREALLHAVRHLEIAARYFGALSAVELMMDIADGGMPCCEHGPLEK